MIEEEEEEEKLYMDLEGGWGDDGVLTRRVRRDGKDGRHEGLF